MQSPAQAVLIFCDVRIKGITVRSPRPGYLKKVLRCLRKGTMADVVKSIKNNKKIINMNQELLSWHLRQNKHRQNAQKEMCL